MALERANHIRTHICNIPLNFGYYVHAKCIYCRYVCDMRTVEIRYENHVLKQSNFCFISINYFLHCPIYFSILTGKFLLILLWNYVYIVHSKIIESIAEKNKLKWIIHKQFGHFEPRSIFYVHCILLEHPFGWKRQSNRNFKQFRWFIQLLNMIYDKLAIVFCMQYTKKQISIPSFISWERNWV